MFDVEPGAPIWIKDPESGKISECQYLGVAYDNAYDEDEGVLCVIYVDPDGMILEMAANYCCFHPYSMKEKLDD